jgi:hypothetical protein
VGEGEKGTAGDGEEVKGKDKMDGKVNGEEKTRKRRRTRGSY